MLAEIITIASDNDFSLARDLIALALADGKMTEEEKAALQRLCAHNSITEEQLIELLGSQANHDNSILSAPKNEKENYIVKMICMMGADGESAAEEIFLLEMVASRLGFSRMHLMSLVLLNATRKNFPKDYGSKVLSSFLSNIVDPKGKSDRQNHDNIAKLFDDIAKSTSMSEDMKDDRKILEHAFNRVSSMMLSDTLLVNEFRSSGLDLSELLVFESKKALDRWTR